MVTANKGRRPVPPAASAAAGQEARACSVAPVSATAAAAVRPHFRTTLEVGEVVAVTKEANGRPAPEHRKKPPLK